MKHQATADWTGLDIVLEIMTQIILYIYLKKLTFFSGR